MESRIPNDSQHFFQHYIRKKSHLVKFDTEIAKQDCKKGDEGICSYKNNGQIGSLSKKQRTGKRQIW